MGGLHLLYPMGLLLLAGLVPLVLLYILKIKRRRQRVSSTWLWAAAQRDLLAKHPFRKLILELPLLLQILGLLALAFALARPSSHGGSIDGDHIAIVIDTSASMATRVGGAQGKSTRIDDAKRAATNLVSQLAPGADAIVIEGGRDARVAAPLDRDPQRLGTAIASLQAHDVEGDLTTAVALAADRLRSLGGRQRIVVVTDGALAHEAPLAPAGIPAEIVAVGDTEENAGIVRIDVRSGVDSATKHEQVQVFILVQSWGTRPRDAYVTLTIEGRGEPIASRRLMLAPGDKQPVVLTFEPRADDHGMGLVVQLSPGDALSVDDMAYGRVPAGLRMPVVIASDMAYSWTTRAIEADPTVDMQRLTMAQVVTVNVDPDALVIVEGACPAALPGRDVMVVAPPAGSCFGVGVGAPVDNPMLTSWESGDPRLRFLTLDGVHVAKTGALDARGPRSTLVRSAATTLVADASEPGRAVTIVGFDVGDSDWPLKASFVLFVRNVVELARLHRAQGAAGPVRTGDPARVSVPVGTTKVTFDGPGLPERELSAKDGFVILPSLERAGLYHVRWNEPHVGGALVAANLTSPQESDVRAHPISIEGSGETTPTTPAVRTIDAHNEWATWLALAAAIVLALDIWWMTRQPRSPRAKLDAPKRGAAA
jgi:VWA domain-containing protein/aerotolerance regulator-like protein